MENECDSEEHQVTLKVISSSIDSVDSGVARINSSHLSCFGEEVPKMVTISSGKKKNVVNLVSDNLAKKGRVILREQDMKDLKVNEGDEITISPYTTLSEDMKVSWNKFKDKLKKHKEEDEEEDEK